MRIGGSSERGNLTIIFEGDDFVLDGKKLFGEFIVSFGGETHTITTTELIRTKKATIQFSEGLQRESEKMKALYARVGVSEGASSKEIIKLLRERGIGGVALPTLSITLWLNDEEDYDYIYNAVFTSVDYFMSLGHDYIKAFEKAFEDPLAIVREGITIIVPKTEELRKFLVKTEITLTMRRVLSELGSGKDLAEMSGNTGVTSPQSGDVYQGGYYPGYQNLPESPPQFFRNRLAVQGGDEVWLENYAWQNFRDYYTRVWIFKKSRFPTKESVREYLNFGMSWCYRPKYLVNFEAILTNCLLSPSYNTSWNHFKQPGTVFTLYKPFVITATSSYQNIPPFLIEIVYGVAEAGFRKHGLTIMGVLISGGVTGSITQNLKATSFTNVNWQEGLRHAALIVPTFMMYYYDAFLLRWDVWSLNNEEWVAVPVPIMTPYYEEFAVSDDDYWSSEYYDSSGNWVSGEYNYVSNIHALLYNMTKTLRMSTDLVRDTLHSYVKTTLELIDSSETNQTQIGESIASLMFGLIDLVLSEVPALGQLLSFVSYADTTFYGSAVKLKLYWVRTGEPQGVPIRVEKTTSQYLNTTYSLIGKAPLVTKYVITVGTSGGPEPCPPNIPCEILEGNKTS